MISIQSQEAGASIDWLIGNRWGGCDCHVAITRKTDWGHLVDVWGVTWTNVDFFPLYFINFKKKKNVYMFTHHKPLHFLIPFILFFLFFSFSHHCVVSLYVYLCHIIMSLVCFKHQEGVSLNLEQTFGLIQRWSKVKRSLWFFFGRRGGEGGPNATHEESFSEVA